MEHISVQLLYELWDAPDDLSHVGFVLVELHLHKLIGSALGYFKECIAGHFHDSRKLFLHKLKELLDNCLQECPVASQESRILSDNVHDAGGNDGLVVLALLRLAQLQ